MTRADAAKMVAVIVAAYPNFDKFKSPQEVGNYTSVLEMMFESEPGAAVALAVKKHIATSKWPPSIAEIREIMFESEHPEIVPPDLAWAAVSDLLYANTRVQWKAVKEKLPPLVARAVEIIGWKQLHDMHTSTVRPGADRVQFISQYTPMYERAKRDVMTPSSIKAAISGNIAALPDNSNHLIERAEEERREEDARKDKTRAANQRALDRLIAKSEKGMEANL